MVILISYDLNGHERPSAYEQVKNAIASCAKDFRKPLYSQWFVETDEMVDTWVDRLTAVMDSDDKLFIMRVQKPYNGWLPQSLYAWISARI